MGRTPGPFEDLCKARLFLPVVFPLIYGYSVFSLFVISANPYWTPTHHKIRHAGPTPRDGCECSWPTLANLFSWLIVFCFFSPFATGGWDKTPIFNRDCPPHGSAF